MMQRSQTCDPLAAMSEADFEESAELFVARGIGRRGRLGYHRFGTATDAIAFAVETYPTARRDGVVLVVGDKRFDLDTIRSLHRQEQADATPAE